LKSNTVTYPQSFLKNICITLARPIHISSYCTELARVSEVSRKIKKRGVIIPDDNIT
jgi:hypothetical protein